MAMMTKFLLISFAFVTLAGAGIVPKLPFGRNHSDVQLSDLNSALQSIEKYCNTMDTTEKCEANQSPVQVCGWNSVASKCSFRSTSCPPELGIKLTAMSQCGATSSNRCPSPCIPAEVQALAVVHVRSGLSEGHTMDYLSQRSHTDAATAQAFADLTYCGLSLPHDLYVDCSKNYTTADVTAAIAAYKQSSVQSSSSSLHSLLYSVASFACILILTQL